MAEQGLPAGSPWLRGADSAAPMGAPVGSFAGAGVRHAYPLMVRDHGVSAAFRLLMLSLAVRAGPFRAFARGRRRRHHLAGRHHRRRRVLVDHVARAFGALWVILCLVGVGWFWGGVLRTTLHLVACGHVAVLTELITTGRVGNGGESMFGYGRRIVTARFGEVAALFGLHTLVRGVVQAFHRTLDWIDEMLPLPGLDALAQLLTMVLRAATRYLDKVIFSYSLARNDQDPWTAAREGIVYYAQNARPILQTALWIVILEKLLSGLVFLLLLAPAAAITVMLPHAVRETGGLVTVLVALLLAATCEARSSSRCF